MDASGFGSTGLLIASITYPGGITLSQWADDADPIDVPDLPIADGASGGGGDAIYWAKVGLVKITLNILPDLSDPNSDDNALRILYEANRPARGKFLAKDVITYTHTFTNGVSYIFSNGKLFNGPPATPWQNSGRFKTSPYGFAFENVVKA